MELVCNAFLTADKVIREDNGKWALIGIFLNFNFSQFPTMAPPWYVFGELGNLDGKKEFSVNLVRDSAQEVIFSVSGEIKVEHPELPTNLVIPVGSVLFSKPGEYVLTLNVDGMPVASRILRVNQIPGGNS